MEFINSSWENLTEKLSELRQIMGQIQSQLIAFEDSEGSLIDLFEMIETRLSQMQFVSTSPQKCKEIENAVKVRELLLFIL